MMLLNLYDLTLEQVFNMKKIFILFYFLIINLSFISFVKSEETIVIVDVNHILSTSENGKKIINELKILKEKNEKNYGLIESKLNKEKKEITRLKNILSENEYNQRVIDFNKNAEKYKLERLEIEKSFENYKKDKLNVFFDNLNDIMKEYMLKNNISFILEKKNILISKSTHDKTKDILKLLNSND